MQQDKAQHRKDGNGWDQPTQWTVEEHRFERVEKREPKIGNVNLKTLVMTSFQVWGKEAQAWQVAFQVENKDLLLSRLRRHMVTMMAEFAAYPGSNITQHPLHDYVVDFVTGGVYMLLRRWAEEGMKRSAEQMGELAYHLVAHYGAWPVAQAATPDFRNSGN